MANSKKARSEKSLAAKKAWTGPSSIVAEEFGNYSIRAGKLSGKFVARAFPKRVANKQGLIAEATGSSELEAIETLKALIEDRSVKRAEERRWDKAAEIAVPSDEEYAEALLLASFTQAQVAMLKSHAVAGADGLARVQLLNAAGYKSHDAASKALASAANLISDHLGAKGPSSVTSSKKGIAPILAFEQSANDEGQEIWVMHEELRQAVLAAL